MFLLLNVGLFCNWLFWTLVAGFLGFLMAWFLRGSNTGEWESKLDAKNAAYSKLEGEHNSFLSKFNKLEKDKSRFYESSQSYKGEVDTLKSKLTTSEGKWGRVNSENQDLLSKLTGWESKYKTLENNFSGKDEAIQKLKAEKEAIGLEKVSLMDAANAAKADKDEIARKIKEYKDRFEDANLERNTLKVKYEELLANRNQSGELLNSLKASNAEMTTELEALRLSSANAESTLAKEREEWTSKYSTLDSTYNEYKAKQDGLQVKYDGLLRMQEQNDAKAKEWRDKNLQLQEEVTGLKAEVSTASNNAAEIGKLNAEIARLKEMESKVFMLKETNAAQYNELAKLKGASTEMESLNDKNKDLQAEIDLLKNRLGEINSLKASNDEMTNRMNEMGIYKQKWSALEDEKPTWISKHKAQDEEIERLKAELERMKTEAAAAPARPLTKEQKEAKAANARNVLQSAIGTKIKRAAASDADDLKLISGVGPFIEKKLNNLGIYTFEQVSQFDGDLVQVVTDAIQFFPGRIQRDNWVDQAGKLHVNKQN